MLVKLGEAVYLWCLRMYANQGWPLQARAPRRCPSWLGLRLLFAPQVSELVRVTVVLRAAGV